MKNFIWQVKQTHHAEQYNDADMFAIFTLDDVMIAKDTDRRLLELISERHNCCVLDALDAALPKSKPPQN